MCPGQTVHIVYQHFLSSINGDRLQIVADFKIKRGGKKKISLDFIRKLCWAMRRDLVLSLVICCQTSWEKLCFINKLNHTYACRYRWTVLRNHSHSNYQKHPDLSNIPHISGVISIPMRSIIDLPFLLRPFSSGLSLTAVNYRSFVTNCHS